jgi:hypothetical protein
MPARSHTSIQKRQRELRRADKQRDKAAKRLARKFAVREAKPDVKLPDEGGSREEHPQ